MKNLIRISASIIIAVAFIFSTQANADEVKKEGRIDFTSKDNVLKPSTHSKNSIIKNISWGKEEKRKSSLFSQSKVLAPDKATTFTVAFIPEKDGNVLLVLKSNWMKKDGEMIPTWVYFTDIKIEGATLKNGNFTEVDDKGTAKDWKWTNKVYDGTGELEGKKCVKVWHNKSCGQSIEVKAGQEVKITATVMPANK